MSRDLFPVPDRVALEVPGCRVWAYVMRIEPGRFWLVPGELVSEVRRAERGRERGTDPGSAEPAPLRPGVSLRLSFYPPKGPGVAMAGRVLWVGSDALSVEVEHPCDVEFTHAWALGRAAALPTFTPRRRVA
jgi:hypothetical protein